MKKKGGFSDYGNTDEAMRGNKQASIHEDNERGLQENELQVL